MTPAELAGYIDHTLLKPDTVDRGVERLCDEAMQYGFATVCVAPFWVPLAVKRLRESDVHIGTTVSFPHGDALTKVKAHESRAALDAGAHEVDMVINIGLVKMGDFKAVQDDIHAVVHTCHGEAIVKVILETSFLTDAEIVSCCRAAHDAGADYVKTSTGFTAGGATVEHVRLMRSVVGLEMGVKAAGGVRDLPMALAMIKAGASRLGCSASVAILHQLDQNVENVPV